MGDSTALNLSPTDRNQPVMLDLRGDPLDIAWRWPVERGLLMLLSGRHHPRWARWSVLAEAPTEPEHWLRIDDAETDPLGQLRAAGVGTTRRCGAFWIGNFSYELGRVIEPAARSRAACETARRPAPPGGAAWPLIELARCDAALLHDGLTGAWRGIGDAESVRRLTGSLCAGATERDGEATIEACEEVVTPRSWMDAVARTVELIRAGDLFQATLSRPLRLRLGGSPRAAALALLERAMPWHGALLEMPDGRSIVSLSPELFLEAQLARDDAIGHAVTRPIKGTRPASAAADELRASAKDLAELVMIVDLMRNDLGRACEIGSVRVSEPRVIESHPTVHHGVATIEGRLRAGVDLADLLAATFPPGSVTGAPKIRAMQVIESLEPFARGPYCGAIGLIGDDGIVRLNVAIRTLAIGAPDTPGGDRIAIYGVGCGVVADSDPEAELRESLDKAKVLGDPPGTT